MSEQYDEIIIDGKKYYKKDLPKSAVLIVEELEHCDREFSSTTINQIRIQGSISALKQALAQSIKNWEQSVEGEESQASE